jgi:hypothetical protein
VEYGPNRLNQAARRFDSFDSARTGPQCWQTRSSKLERRNKERPNKNVFHPWGPILDRAMHETMRDVGMWLDNSSLGVTETVDEILRRSWVQALLS